MPDMRIVKLYRIESDDLGTFGTFMTDDAIFSCWTAELPWRDNKPGLSCIPEGRYRCVWGLSPDFGQCYHVTAVPGQENILIRSGNFVGDVEKGLKASVQGSIVLGRAIGTIGGQKAVLSSSDALAGFESEMGGQQFDLIISRKQVNR